MEINRYPVFIWSYNYFRFLARPRHHLSYLTSTCSIRHRSFFSLCTWTLKIAHVVLEIILFQSYSRKICTILATALDFWRMSTSCDTGSGTIEKLDPQNIGLRLAVGILLLCALELEIAQGWASECPDVKNYKWRLNPVWHRMLYSCTHMGTVGVKGLNVVLCKLFIH